MSFGHPSFPRTTNTAPVEFRLGWPSGSSDSLAAGLSAPPGAHANAHNTPSSSATFESSSSPRRQSAPPKRVRVLLSCGPCRASKLKCDRGQPCSQCLRKARTEMCMYAPRPEKGSRRPTKGMTARLRRLEGMVRDMMDGGGEEESRIPTSGPEGGGEADDEVPVPSSAAIEGFGVSSGQRGQVVVGGTGRSGSKTATYVGATHFMAMLDDIEDLKSYFDQDDDHEPGDPETDSPDLSPESFLFSASPSPSRRELLAHLPPKRVVERLVMRYFNAYSVSQHVIYRKTFIKQHTEFWKDPSKAPLDWVALLFTMLALGTLFSTFTAPHELQDDNDTPPAESSLQYRAAAGSALALTKFSSPSLTTLQAFLLYLEGEFLMSGAAQMDCYLLSSMCIRLMLRMGLHRDPSGLPSISPFEGEMRRRMWNLAIQLDLIISFHVGLPSMLHGIETDTGLPRNLIEEDLDEHLAELPPSRPDGEYTHLTYPIWKTSICRIFGLVARQAHSLSAPDYAEVMRLDRLLEEKWAQLPPLMEVRPVQDTIADPPHMTTQRFGLASLYQKARCVLHRRYLVEAAPRPEHEYSRRTCIAAAIQLLDYQNTAYRATLPGGFLRQNGWFLSPLAIHDLLLAAMIIYIAVQKDVVGSSRDGGDPDNKNMPIPDRDELRNVLDRSHDIWAEISRHTPAAKKAAEMLEMMMGKMRPQTEPLGGEMEMGGAPRSFSASLGHRTASSELDAGHSIVPISNLSLQGSSVQTQDMRQMGSSESGLVANYPPAQATEPPWLALGDTTMDWSAFDDVIRPSINAVPRAADTAATEWEEVSSFDGLDPAFWGVPNDFGQEGGHGI